MRHIQRGTLGTEAWSGTFGMVRRGPQCPNPEISEYLGHLEMTTNFLHTSHALEND